MTWVAVAVAGAGVAGAAISSGSAKSAAGAQSDAAGAATALQQQQYDQTVARNAPFTTGGTSAFNALLGRLGLAGSDGTAASGYGSLGHVPTAEEVMATPGYQFGLDQGQNALNRQLNARGMSYSGAQGKALARYGTDYATTKYNDAFNNLQSGNQQVYNQLMGAAGLGQQSANNTSAYGNQFATQAGNNMMGAANAQGAATIASGNAWGNALNQGVSAYKNYQAPTAQPDYTNWNSGTGGSGSTGAWGGSAAEPWYG
jgi:hypothetical protein